MKTTTCSLFALISFFSLSACSDGTTEPGANEGTTTGGLGASAGGAGTGATGAGASSGAGGGTGAGATTGAGGNGGGVVIGSGGSNGGVVIGAGGGAGTGGNGAGAAGSGGGAGEVVVKPDLIVSGPNSYWQEAELVMGGSNASVTVTATALQDWHGFGGTFNEKGWEAMKSLSPADRDTAIRLLFGKADGAAFTYGRIPIGSSDYANSRYSLNETANDLTMENFSIERDKQDLIPYIKSALAVNPDIHFWASPWTPPTWMKENIKPELSPFDGGNMRDEPSILDAHALYLARFVEEYEKEGIHIEAVHPQNEPGWEQEYPSCLWTGATLATYIADHMGPTFEERVPGVEIWLGTMSNSNSTDRVAAVMGNEKARSYVSGIGMQWAMGDGNAPSQYSSMYAGLPLMQTEHICGNFPWVNGTDQSRAPNDHAYALDSWGYFKNWIGKGVNSYSAWNMVLDTVGRSLDDGRPWAQNALLVVDTQAKQLIATPTYFVFRHLSQYVVPGAVRLQTQGGDALAFENPDGSIVAVIHNPDGQAAMTTVSIGGSMVQANIPGSGWATINWEE